jgi:hypothetical protein
MERKELARPSLHRRLPLPLPGRFRFRVLAQALAHLVAEVHPSHGLALRLRWFRSVLGRDCRPLRHEALVAEANPLGQLFPHQCQILFCPICARSLVEGA